MTQQVVFNVVLISLLFLTGCSSSNPIELQDYQIPEFPDSGHAILQAGTIEIDIQNNEVSDVDISIDPFYNSISDLLQGNLNFSIVNYDPPDLILDLKIENPFTKSLYDMRIIYMDLYGNEVINPDGYTNFYDNCWNPGYNPFNYLGENFPKHKVPLKSEGFIFETLQFDWQQTATPYISYLIEASVGNNTYEPYAIRNINLDGDITPGGGSAIVSCTVHDWYDALSVKIFSDDFMHQSSVMFNFENSNDFYGNLINEKSVLPGHYSIWVMAESTRSSSTNVTMPYVLHIEELDGLMSSRIEPKALPQKFAYQYDEWEDAILSEIELKLYEHSPELELQYEWEQLSPSQPEGYFTDTTQSDGNRVIWHPPDITEDTLFLFKVASTDTGNQLTSKAIIPLTSERPKTMEIVSGPSFYPAEIYEGDHCEFRIEVRDPNFPEEDHPYFSCWWDQYSPAEPQGVWLDTNGLSRTTTHTGWIAPEVDNDTTFIISAFVYKFWLDPALENSKQVEFVVKNRD